MQGWLAHMPSGMRLKSEGFASNIYDPDASLTLKQFCAEKGIAYADSGLPVTLQTFTEYGLCFQQRFVPNLENRILVGLDQGSNGFSLEFADGERIRAKKVVLAIGMAKFGHTPGMLARLPSEFVSHSSQHSDLRPFAGRRVAVIGGGSSAIDVADLANDCGADIQLIARRQSLRFHNPPTGEQRTFWQNIRYPMTGMGPGLRARLYTDAPIVFHALPQQIRRNIVLDYAPPEGGWFSKDRVLGRVPLHLGCSVEKAEVEHDAVNLELLGADGTRQKVIVDHVIAATGYRVDLAKFAFLSDGIQSRLRLRSAFETPILSARFESSVPGLYFVGLPAMLSFGPMMRFALGAGYTARRLAGVLAHSSSRRRDPQYGHLRSDAAA